MRLFRTLLAVALLLMILVPASAWADSTTYNFTGTLTSSFGGSDTISGKFAIDFATDSITSFNFTTPFGVVDTTNYTAFLFDSGGFLGLDFNGPMIPVYELILFFQTPIPFDSAPLYTLPFLPGPAASGVPLEMQGGSVANCFSTTMPPGVCTTAGGSTFASGMAVSTPEPSTLAFVSLGFLLFAFVRRK